MMQESLNFGPKLRYLDIFSLTFENFLSNLKFFKTQSFAQN